jgi:hypothetical protein
MIEYTRADYSKNGKKYDIVLVAAGKRRYFSGKSSLTENSVFVLESPKLEYQLLQILLSPLFGDRRAKMHLPNPNEKDINFLRELIEAEKIKTGDRKDVYFGSDRGRVSPR